MSDIYSVVKDHKVINTKLLSFGIRVPKRISNKLRGWRGRFCISTMGCVIANLVACTRKNNLLVYSRDVSTKVDDKKGITVKKVITCITYLEAQGYVINSVGKGSKTEGERKISHLEPTAKFLGDFCTTEDKVKELEEEHILSLPVFVVKDSKGNVIDITPTEEVKEGGKTVRALNLLNSKSDTRDGSGNPLSNLYIRSYNESFEYGGRWYLADILHLKHNFPGQPQDKARYETTIDGVRVVEIDYVNHHFRCTAAKLGIVLDRIPTDIYLDLLGKNETEVGRCVVKQAINILFNCDTRGRAVAAIANVIRELSPFEQSNLGGLTASGIIHTVLSKYPEFEQIFKIPKWGCILQKEDGWLDDKVVKRLLPHRIECLPIHDSFIVKREHEARLAIAMGEAFREQFRVDWPVPVKVGWKDDGKIYTKSLIV